VHDLNADEFTHDLHNADHSSSAGVSCGVATTRAAGAGVSCGASTQWAAGVGGVGGGSKTLQTHLGASGGDVGLRRRWHQILGGAPGSADQGSKTLQTHLGGAQPLDQLVGGAAGGDDALVELPPIEEAPTAARRQRRLSVLQQQLLRARADSAERGRREARSTVSILSTPGSGRSLSVCVCGAAKGLRLNVPARAR
jgi:hypothetical protein